MTTLIFDYAKSSLEQMLRFFVEYIDRSKMALSLFGLIGLALLSGACDRESGKSAQDQRHGLGGEKDSNSKAWSDCDQFRRRVTGFVQGVDYCYPVFGAVGNRGRVAVILTIRCPKDFDISRIAISAGGSSEANSWEVVVGDKGDLTYQSEIVVSVESLEKGVEIRDRQGQCGFNLLSDVVREKIEWAVGEVEAGMRKSFVYADGVNRVDTEEMNRAGQRE